MNQRSHQHALSLTNTGSSCYSCLTVQLEAAPASFRLGSITECQLHNSSDDTEAVLDQLNPQLRGNSPDIPLRLKQRDSGSDLMGPEMTLSVRLLRTSDNDLFIYFFHKWMPSFTKTQTVFNPEYFC